MTRRILLLNGLAILAVVLNHAAGWGQIAMFLWADRYRAVSVPNWDQLGSLGYYTLLAVRQFTSCAVPIFIFVSGFSVAYAARGYQSTSVWKVVRARTRHLLVPYLIWSAVLAIGLVLQGTHYSLLEYLQRFVTLGVDGPYFFVPLLCYLYVLAPLMIPLGKAKVRWLLAVCAFIQLGGSLLEYMRLMKVDMGAWQPIMRVLPIWLPTKWVFYFALGIAVSLHTRQFERWLFAHKRILSASALVTFLLCLLESDLTLRVTLSHWGVTFGSISYILYSVSFILCYLSCVQLAVPLRGAAVWLGKRSYGIYLLHATVIELVARVVRRFAPWVLAQHVLLVFPLMFAVGLGIPLLAMAILARSPARKFYPYLFG